MQGAVILANRSPSHHGPATARRAAAKRGGLGCQLFKLFGTLRAIIHCFFMLLLVYNGGKSLQGIGSCAQSIPFIHVSPVSGLVHMCSIWFRITCWLRQGKAVCSLRLLSFNYPGRKNKISIYNICIGTARTQIFYNIKANTLYIYI